MQETMTCSKSPFTLTKIERESEAILYLPQYVDIAENQHEATSLFLSVDCA